MAEGPSIAIPHWRAPTWERTQHYRDSLRRCGGGLVVVQGDDLPPEVQGLLLTGGVDLDPRLYGQRRRPQTERPNKERDAHELRLLRQALERDLPVLAVCRGHQLLNVALGGSLLQHIKGNIHRYQDDGASRWHEVRLQGNSRLARIYAGARSLRVNSRHHQAVTADRLGSPLTAVAQTPDGYVEAVEGRHHRWVVGVQWHPERPELRPAADALFAAFVDACRT